VQTPDVPGWFPVAGVMFGGLTLLFFMGLAVAGLFGKDIPCSTRFPVLVVIAFGSALAASFLGGSAVAKGRLPFPFTEAHPLQFGVGGGIAMFVIVLVLSHWIYPGVNCANSPTLVASTPTPTSMATATPGCKLAPGNTGVYNDGVKQLTQQKWDTAIQAFNEVLLCEQQNDISINARAYHNRGLAYLRQEQWELAIQDTQRATELNPDDYLAHYRLCWMQVVLSEPGGALAYCDRAIELRQESRCYQARGVAHALLNNFASAIADLQVSVDMLMAEGEPDPFDLTNDLTEQKAWIEELKNGTNPFTPDQLDKMRQDGP
jgi:hypothetical protein